MAVAVVLAVLMAVMVAVAAIGVGGGVGCGGGSGGDGSDGGDGGGSHGCGCIVGCKGAGNGGGGGYCKGGCYISPKVRCNVPKFLEIYEAQQKLSAIDHLKNYPRNSISQSQVKESILSKTRVHISLTNDDDIEHGIITYVNDKWKEGNGRHMNDLFSQSKMNSNFNSPQKVGSVWARSSLKQLW